MHSQDTQQLIFHISISHIYNCTYKTPFGKSGHIFSIIVSSSTVVFFPGYFAHVACLNNLLSMSKQLISEVQNADTHKYISYETALLHVSNEYVPLSSFNNIILTNKLLMVIVLAKSSQHVKAAFVLI